MAALSRTSPAEQERAEGDDEAMGRLFDVLQRALGHADADEIRAIRNEWKESRRRAGSLLADTLLPAKNG